MMEFKMFLEELNKIVKEWESGTRDAERAMEIISCLVREVDCAEG
jgi:hypothetical protein